METCPRGQGNDPKGTVGDRPGLPLTSFHALIASFIHPHWNGNGTDVSGLAQKVGYDPVLCAELYGLDVQAEQLAAAESTSYQHGENRVIPFASERVAIHSRQEPLALIGGEPVPDADSNQAHSLDPSDPGRKFRT
jgi:hypothetical protein